MSLQFYFGGSGAGKSSKLHGEIVEWSLREPETSFLFVVPDQFTMYTQMELVKAHPRRGILNIDVLSFGRLSHRIFEEVGREQRAVLDDTGKSLVLRKVAADIRKESPEALPVIGKNLHKLGYIHEVKSAVSEFMQYGIGPKELEQLTAFTAKKGVLHSKLKDLGQLYSGFLAYIKQEFITTEETLGLLKNALCRSLIIPGSVVIFDGFTGFTPIQNQVIQELLRLTKRVIVSITIGSETDPFGEIKEQELFYLSKKTVRDLCRLAAEVKAEREEDCYFGQESSARFAKNEEMAHLEKHLFRYPLSSYEKENQAIVLSEVSTIEEEVRQTCIKIKELTLIQGLQYREIAVVTGDMNSYGAFMEQEADKYGIPLFMDRTRGILLNPFIEFIRSALKVVIQNFSYEAVFHYLRSGFVDCTPEEIDRLENYVIGCGIRGRKKWNTVFTRRSRRWEAGKEVGLLEELNHTRYKMMEQLKPLENKEITVGERIQALYEFIVGSRIQQKLAAYEAYFRERNDFVRVREYGQIYRLVMELLEQIHSLLREERMTLREFADILDAGFGEMEVGTIPQNVDRVVVGDMERTRLTQIRVLFFLGVNDGKIPGNKGKGGLISDLDREFLKDSPWELSPTPRQQMYIQRLYLYLNMTKPSERLYLSYANVDADGKSMRPSYLIGAMQKLFPDLAVERPERNGVWEQVVGLADSLDLFVSALREYASGRKKKKEEALQRIRILSSFYEKEEDYRLIKDRLVEGAFAGYTRRNLAGAIAEALYGSMLECSVSRLETYASCAYSHFLQYGLALQEREEYGFEPVDLGNVFHGVLELFARKLAEANLRWFDFPEEEGMRLLGEALEGYAAEYGGTVLFDSARKEQMLGRIFRILARTVRTLQQQLQKGRFVPEQFEVSFSKADKLESVHIALSEQEIMKLRGRIDRIDLYEDQEHVYVKVIDYKSGKQKFDLAAFYYGLQLQLVVYMNVAMEMAGAAHPEKEVVPAAFLYYHVSDPMIKAEDMPDAEEMNRRVLEELRMTGLVHESQEVIALLEGEVTGKSLTLPIERKKDGSFSKRSGVMNKEGFGLLSAYMENTIRKFGREIKEGNIAVNPFEGKEGRACDWCNYRSVCGYDKGIPGYDSRRTENLTEPEWMARMRKELEEEGHDW